MFRGSKYCHQQAYNDAVDVAALPQPHIAPIVAPAPAKPKYDVLLQHKNGWRNTK